MKSLLISSRKGLVIYNQKGGQWTYDNVHFKGIPVCLTHHDQNTNELWAFLDHGHWGVKLQKSLDFGNTWTEVPAMKYPEGCEVKQGVPAALQYIWAVEKDLHGRLWVGTVPGGLFMSEDGGETFELNNGLWNHEHREKHWFGGGMDHPGVHSIVLDPANPDHMYVGVSVGGVYETLDGGGTWQVRNSGLRADFMPEPLAELSHDPHLLVACKSSPRHLWQQNHCGIFKSDNGGVQWQDVTQANGPANFGFAIAVDDNNPDVAWVAPGISDEIRVAVDQSLCICRTEDGGSTWTDLRAGLPQGTSFDIVYRHALARHDGEMIFGTTTGNLFHSGNDGDSWETMSNFLPLINAVTFAET